MECVGKVLNMLLTPTLNFLNEQGGYFLRVEENVNNLRDEIECLRNLSEDVHTCVHNAEKNSCWIRKKVVVGWMQRVDRIQQETKDIEKKYDERPGCLADCSSSISVSYTISMEAIKKLRKVKDLIREGETYKTGEPHDVAYPSDGKKQPTSQDQVAKDGISSSMVEDQLDDSLPSKRHITASSFQDLHHVGLPPANQDAVASEIQGIRRASPPCAKEDATISNSQCSLAAKEDTTILAPTQGPQGTSSLPVMQQTNVDSLKHVDFSNSADATASTIQVPLIAKEDPTALEPIRNHHSTSSPPVMQQAQPEPLKQSDNSNPEDLSPAKESADDSSPPKRQITASSFQDLHHVGLHPANQDTLASEIQGIARASPLPAKEGATTSNIQGSLAAKEDIMKLAPTQGPQSTSSMPVVQQTNIDSLKHTNNSNSEDATTSTIQVSSTTKEDLTTLEPMRSPQSTSSSPVIERAHPEPLKRSDKSKPGDLSATKIVDEAIKKDEEASKIIVGRHRKEIKTEEPIDAFIHFLYTNGNSLGFGAGKPVAAFTIYRCLLHWRSFEAERTSVFDRLVQLIWSAVENEEDNDNLVYWLSNTSTLLFLLQKSLKAAGAPGAVSRKKPPQPTSLFGRMAQGFRSASLVNMTVEATEVIRQVEAKYPALLFKQQLIAFVEKIYGIIRDNIKKELSSLIALCIQAPRTMKASMLRISGRLSGSQSQSSHWQKIIESLDNLLKMLQDNHVPSVLAQKIFTQIFSYINVQLFNSLLLRRECCSFSNGEYVKSGLAELELWCAKAKAKYAGTSWDELKHIRQAIGFLVIFQKFRISYDEIVNDLCPILSVQQLYRICTQYWDDKYNTQSVSSDVIGNLRILMTEDSNSAESSSFLLDDNSSIPFSVDDIAESLQENFTDTKLPAPEELLENAAFEFLRE